MVGRVWLSRFSTGTMKQLRVSRHTTEHPLSIKDLPNIVLPLDKITPIYLYNFSLATNLLSLQRPLNEHLPTETGPVTNTFVNQPKFTFNEHVREALTYIAVDKHQHGVYIQMNIFKERFLKYSLG